MVSYNFENILCWKPPCILLFTINKPNALLADLATALAIMVELRIGAIEFVKC
jgi:hypothetical protein